jgi:hypothetical protein
MNALKTILPALPANFPLSIAIVQHRNPQSDGYLAKILSDLSAITIKEAEDKERLLPRVAYLAPADYHLLIEPDRSFSLSVDEKVNFSRPSIDLLFESAADTFAEKLIGKRAARVAEEVAVDNRIGNGAAVDGHERLVAPRALIVNPPRQVALAATRLARNENCAR